MKFSKWQSIVLLATAAGILGACGGGSTVQTVEVPGGEIVVVEVPGAEAYSADSGPSFTDPNTVPGCCPEEEYDPYQPLPPRDNFFQNYGVNAFVDPRVDALSTFAVDVDTASYTVARRYVHDGLLPPEDAIRVEEFINFFDGGYLQPANAAFGVYVDGAPSPFHNDGTYFLRIGIQGYSIPEETRKPANLVFVIDASGSMDMENRLELVKKSLEMLLSRLGSRDLVGIVAFNTTARIVLPPTPASSRSEIMGAINRLRPDGSTNAEAGLQLGYEMAMENFNRQNINRVILVSDGVANVGNTSASGILQLTRGYANAGVTLTTMGFGMGNFNDVLLEQLADDGNGTYAYIDNLEEAERLFVDELASTLQTIALDAKIQVEFDPSTVSLYRLVGYENRGVADEDFRNDEVEAGEIGAGHSVTALYALQLRPGAQGQLGRVTLRWQDPDDHRALEIFEDFGVWSLARDYNQTDPHFQLAAVTAQYAELLRKSPWAGPGTLESLIPYAYQAAAQLVFNPDAGELATLISRANELRP